MRLFPCAMLFGVSRKYIWRWPRVERFGAFGESSVAETDRVREVGNYVHSWRPLYGFGVCLSLRLWYRCLRHVDRGPAARSYIEPCYASYAGIIHSAAFMFSLEQLAEHVIVFQFHSRRIYERIYVDCLYRHLAATNKPMHAASVFIIFAFQSPIRLR